MNNSLTALLDNIRLGENTYLECKEVRFSGTKIKGPSRDAMADELAAFANSRGGVLVLGVEDKTHDVLGIPIERLDQVVKFVRQVCLDSIDPPLESFVLEHLQLPAVTGGFVPVVKVEVPRSLFVHRSPGGYMLRAGDSKRQMSPPTLARLFQQRSQSRLIRFDEQAVADASLDDLIPELWKRFRTDRSDDDHRDFLRKLGLANEVHGDVWIPTVAGILMASRDPRKWMPNAYIQAVAYRGVNVRPAGPAAYQLDAMDIVGPLDQQVVDACQFVIRNMRIAAYKGSSVPGRRDLPQFELAAVFEALVNAVAHRDYSIYESKIRLRLFADRLELYSPGSLVNSMTVDRLRYTQAARNETLCSILTKCELPDKDWLTSDRHYFMEKRGEGVPIILDDSERLSGHTPDYQLIDDRELLLTIYAAGD